MDAALAEGDGKWQQHQHHALTMLITDNRLTVIPCLQVEAPSTALSVRTRTRKWRGRAGAGWGCGKLVPCLSG